MSEMYELVVLSDGETYDSEAFIVTVTEEQREEIYAGRKVSPSDE